MVLPNPNNNLHVHYCGTCGIQWTGAHQCPGIRPTIITNDGMLNRTDVLGTWVDSLMAKLNRLARLEPLVAAIVAAATTPPPGYEDDGAPGGLWHGHKALDDAVEALVRAERGAP